MVVDTSNYSEAKLLALAAGYIAVSVGQAHTMGIETTANEMGYIYVRMDGDGEMVEISNTAYTTSDEAMDAAGEETIEYTMGSNNLSSEAWDRMNRDNKTRLVMESHGTL